MTTEPVVTHIDTQTDLPTDIRPDSEAAPIERTTLTPTSIPSLLEAIHEPNGILEGSWNAVEAMELLLDGGQFNAVLSLADRVLTMLGEDPRERLFAAYRALASIIARGDVEQSLVIIEHRAQHIRNGHHSVHDIMRINSIMARALAVSVSMGCLPDHCVHRARMLLSAEFMNTPRDSELMITIGIELARLNLFGPLPDPMAAAGVLTALDGAMGVNQCKEDLKDEVDRLWFALSLGKPIDGHRYISLEQANEKVNQKSDLERAYWILSISRRVDPRQMNEAWLDEALVTFARYGLLGGAFQIAHRRAQVSLMDRHYPRAERWLKLALEYAQSGGFLHGEIVALIGLFNCAVGTGMIEESHGLLKVLDRILSSDVGWGAGGLSIAASYQMAGNFEKAATITRTCEKFFGERGLPTLESQAAFMLGASAAGSHEWLEAKKAWERSLRVEKQVRNFAAIGERRIAIAQALAMVEFTKTKGISLKTWRKIEVLLERAHSDLFSALGGVELNRAVSKMLQTYSQLCIMARRPLEGLKALNRAREVTLQLDSPREVALIDAACGLTLIEVAKIKGPSMFEEANSALHRALECFREAQDAEVRWKLKYYLCISAVMIMQAAVDESEKAHWQQVAVSWYRQARSDLQQVRRSELAPALPGGEVVFSPGLSPDSLDQIRKVLGIDEEKVRPKTAKSGSEVRIRRSGKYLH